MSKIDKDALVAEIGRLRNMIERSKFRSEDDKFEPYTKDGYGLALDDVLSFIDSLQQEQPEVDLEDKVTFDCISKKVTMTVRELINYYIDRECCEVAEECGF